MSVLIITAALANIAAFWLTLYQLKRKPVAINIAYIIVVTGTAIKKPPATLAGTEGGK